MNTTETTIPERTYRTVEIVVKARDIAIGDVIVGLLDDEHSARVVDGSNKRTKTWVTLEGQATPVGLAQDEDVTVERRVETDESVAARRAAYVEERARNLIESYEPALVRARDALAKELLESKTRWVDKDQLGGLLVAQQMHHEVLNAMPTTDPATVESFTYAAVVRWLRKRFTRELVEGSNGPTWSGGFTFTNAELQAVQEAKRSFLRTTEYWFDED